MLSIWTGFTMTVDDAFATLLGGSYPHETLHVSGYAEKPTYVRRIGETSESADARFIRAEETYEQERDAAFLAAAGKAALRLIAADAAGRCFHAEWRDERGNEDAVFRLAAEYDRRFPAPGLAYVIGPQSMLADVAKQGVHFQPGSAQRKLLPGVIPRAFLSFMNATLALCPVEGVRYPVIVAPHAYAVLVKALNDVDVFVAVQPVPDGKVGVIGASAEDVMADLQATFDAPPTFDATDFATRLRLRRMLAQKPQET